MSWIDTLHARAREGQRRIIFPESADPRILEAVRFLAAKEIVKPVLVLGERHDETHGTLGELGVEVLYPASDSRTEVVGSLLARRREFKGLSRGDAETLALSPLYFAAGLVALGEVHGSVAGAITTTADVLRAALWCVGPAAGVSTVSSAFYMLASPFRTTNAEVLTFTDCAVIPEPTAGQLADIAIAASLDRRRIVGDEPRVALLSYSTRGSGTGESVSRVRKAVELIRARAPELMVDGELQSDAALIEEIGMRKAPDSSVAGRANVLVFPSLESGNIAYKLVERICGARAIGPIVQGLARPCSDLSRGASADDIINVAAITALQAAPQRDLE